MTAKFRPRSSIKSNSSSRGRGGPEAGAGGGGGGILKKDSSGREKEPVALPGRIISDSRGRQHSSTSASAADLDNLALNDGEKVYQLLDNYRRQVSVGEMCGGDCPNDGILCPSGICRAHLRYCEFH